MKIVFDKILGMLREMDEATSSSENGSGESGNSGSGGSSSNADIVVSGASSSSVNGGYSKTNETYSDGFPIYSNGTYYLFQGMEDGMSYVIIADNLNNKVVEDEGGNCGWIYKASGNMSQDLSQLTFYAGIYGSQQLNAQNGELSLQDNRPSEDKNSL